MDALNDSSYKKGEISECVIAELVMLIVPARTGCGNGNCSSEPPGTDAGNFL